MTKIYDVAIIGAGAVGCAIARELSRYQLKIALIESNSDVGMGTSKASTAIWHTGYDAKPGSLEAKLLKRSYALMDKYLVAANIAHERIGGLLIAWNQEQLDTLPALLKQAHENGDTDVKIISAEEIYKREPNINKGALGGLFVPGEGILCTFSVPLAFAYQAILNDVKLFLNQPVQEIKQVEDRWIINNEIEARYIVNAAGSVIAGFFAEGKTWTVKGPFNLGAWSKPNAIISAIGVGLLATTGFFPPNQRVFYLTIAMLIVLPIVWFAGVKDTFEGVPTGAKIKERQKMIAEIEAKYKD